MSETDDTCPSCGATLRPTDDDRAIAAAAAITQRSLDDKARRALKKGWNDAPDEDPPG